MFVACGSEVPFAMVFTGAISNGAVGFTAHVYTWSTKMGGAGGLLKLGDPTVTQFAGPGDGVTLLGVTAVPEWVE